MERGKTIEVTLLSVQCLPQKKGSRHPSVRMPSAEERASSPPVRMPSAEEMASSPACACVFRGRKSKRSLLDEQDRRELRV